MADAVAAQVPTSAAARLAPGRARRRAVWGCGVAAIVLVGLSPWLGLIATSYVALWGVGGVAQPSFSVTPDGRHLAIAARGRGRSDLYLYDLARGTTRRLTHGLGEECEPVLSSSGAAVYYSYGLGPRARIWRLDPATGRNQAVTRGRWDFGPQISGDGRWLLFARCDSLQGHSMGGWSWADRHLLAMDTGTGRTTSLPVPSGSDIGWYSCLSSAPHEAVYTTNQGEATALWRISLPDGAPRQLGLWRGCGLVAISPNGESVAVSRPNPTDHRTRLAALSISDGTEVPLGDVTGKVAAVAWLGQEPALAVLTGYPGAPYELWRVTGGTQVPLLAADWFTQASSAPDATWPLASGHR